MLTWIISNRWIINIEGQVVYSGNCKGIINALGADDNFSSTSRSKSAGFPSGQDLLYLLFYDCRNETKLFWVMAGANTKGALVAMLVLVGL